MPSKRLVRSNQVANTRKSARGKNASLSETEAANDEAAESLPAEDTPEENSKRRSTRKKPEADDDVAVVKEDVDISDTKTPPTRSPRAGRRGVPATTPRKSARGAANVPEVESNNDAVEEVQIETPTRSSRRKVKSLVTAQTSKSSESKDLTEDVLVETTQTSNEEQDVVQGNIDVEVNDDAIPVEDTVDGSNANDEVTASENVKDDAMPVEDTGDGSNTNDEVTASENVKDDVMAVEDTGDGSNTNDEVTASENVDDDAMPVEDTNDEVTASENVDNDAMPVEDTGDGSKANDEVTASENVGSENISKMCKDDEKELVEKNKQDDGKHCISEDLNVEENDFDELPKTECEPSSGPKDDTENNKNEDSEENDPEINNEDSNDSVNDDSPQGSLLDDSFEAENMEVIDSANEDDVTQDNLDTEELDYEPDEEVSLFDPNEFMVVEQDDDYMSLLKEGEAELANAGTGKKKGSNIQERITRGGDKKMDKSKPDDKKSNDGRNNRNDRKRVRKDDDSSKTNDVKRPREDNRRRTRDDDRKRMRDIMSKSREEDSRKTRSSDRNKSREDAKSKPNDDKSKTRDEDRTRKREDDRKRVREDDKKKPKDDDGVKKTNDNKQKPSSDDTRKSVDGDKKRPLEAVTTKTHDHRGTGSSAESTIKTQEDDTHPRKRARRSRWETQSSDEESDDGDNSSRKDLLDEKKEKRDNVVSWTTPRGSDYMKSVRQIVILAHKDHERQLKTEKFGKKPVTVIFVEKLTEEVVCEIVKKHRADYGDNVLWVLTSGISELCEPTILRGCTEDKCKKPISILRRPMTVEDLNKFFESVSLLCVNVQLELGRNSLITLVPPMPASLAITTDHTHEELHEIANDGNSFICVKNVHERFLAMYNKFCTTWAEVAASRLKRWLGVSPFRCYLDDGSMENLSLVTEKEIYTSALQIWYDEMEQFLHGALSTPLPTELVPHSVGKVEPVPNEPDVLFEQVVVIGNTRYTDKLQQLTDNLPVVHVDDAMNFDKQGLASLLEREKKYPGKTLWVILSGVSEIANFLDSGPPVCINSNCKKPIFAFVPKNHRLGDPSFRGLSIDKMSNIVTKRAFDFAIESSENLKDGSAVFLAPIIPLRALWAGEGSPYSHDTLHKIHEEHRDIPVFMGISKTWMNSAKVLETNWLHKVKKNLVKNSVPHDLILKYLAEKHPVFDLLHNHTQVNSGDIRIPWSVLMANLIRHFLGRTILDSKTAVNAQSQPAGVNKPMDATCSVVDVQQQVSHMFPFVESQQLPVTPLQLPVFGKSILGPIPVPGWQGLAPTDAMAHVPIAPPVLLTPESIPLMSVGQSIPMVSPVMLPQSSVPMVPSPMVPVVPELQGVASTQENPQTKGYLLIQGVETDMDETLARRLLQEFGELKNVTWPRDQKDNPAGFIMVNFKYQNDAGRAARILSYLKTFGDNSDVKFIGGSGTNKEGAKELESGDLEFLLGVHDILTKVKKESQRKKQEAGLLNAQLMPEQPVAPVPKVTEEKVENLEPNSVVVGNVTDLVSKELLLDVFHELGSETRGYIVDDKLHLAFKDASVPVVLTKYRFPDKRLTVEIDGPGKNLKLTQPERFDVWMKIKEPMSRVLAEVQNVLKAEVDEGFNVYKFKTNLCVNGNACKDKAKCVDYHSQLDRRRSLDLYEYSNELCPAMEASGSCSEADRCSKAHSPLEVLFHSENYKKFVCYGWKSKNACKKKGRVCASAHPGMLEVLFNDRKENLYCQGTRNTVHLLASAIRNLYTAPKSKGVQVLLIASNDNLANMYVGAVQDLAADCNIKMVKFDKMIVEEGTNVIITTFDAIQPYLLTRDELKYDATKHHMYDLSTVQALILDDSPALMRMAQKKRDLLSALGMKDKCYYVTAPRVLLHDIKLLRKTLKIEKEFMEITETEFAPKQDDVTQRDHHPDLSVYIHDMRYLVQKVKEECSKKAESSGDGNGAKYMTQKEYEKAIEELQRKHNADLEQFTKSPELHSEYNDKHEMFMEEYQTHFPGQQDEAHAQQLWQAFWVELLQATLKEELENKRGELDELYKKQLELRSQESSTKTSTDKSRNQREKLAKGDDSRSQSNRSNDRASNNTNRNNDRGSNNANSNNDRGSNNSNRNDRGSSNANRNNDRGSNNMNRNSDRVSNRRDSYPREDSISRGQDAPNCRGASDPYQQNRRHSMEEGNRYRQPRAQTSYNDGQVDIEAALELLKEVSPALGMLGPTIHLLYSEVSTRWPNRAEICKFLREQDCKVILQTVSDKARELSQMAGGGPNAMKLQMASVQALKLLNYPNTQGNESNYGLDIEQIARLTLNKDPTYAIDTIKRALIAKGRTNVSDQKIYELYVEVINCSESLKEKTVSLSSMGNSASSMSSMGNSASRMSSMGNSASRMNTSNFNVGSSNNDRYGMSSMDLFRSSIGDRQNSDNRLGQSSRGRLSDNRGRQNNDNRGRQNNDNRGRQNNDNRGRQNNDNRGRQNNDNRGRQNNDNRGRQNNDNRGRQNNDNRGRQGPNNRGGRDRNDNQRGQGNFNRGNESNNRNGGGDGQSLMEFLSIV